jgi:RluA family pseudouridine synthase
MRIIDDANIEIVFEDRWLLAVNKPAGLPTQPSVDRSRPNLYTRLLDSQNWEYLGLHHRLDVPTSGLVLFTKNKSANKGVSELFKGRNLQKNYQCLVQGLPESVSFELRNHLKPLKLRTGKTKMVSTLSGGDQAHTLFEVLERFRECSLLRASPLTGRMHQIRTHLADLNLPILGDSLYFRVDRKYPRLMLHAAQLIFEHPITRENVQLVAPLPKDFEERMRRLRLEATV